MDAATVVEDFDVLEDAAAGGGNGGHGGPVDEFSLEGGEEALGNGVVPALPGTAERLADMVPGQELAECGRGVLATPVGMEDEPGSRTTALEGHRQRIGHQA